MDVSPNALRRETVRTLNQVNSVIESITQEAVTMGKNPANLLDQNHNWVLSAPLLAKAQCLQTLTMLNEQGKRR